MKRLLLHGLSVLLIGAAVVFVVYYAQQQAACRASPAGLIAEAANTIAEGGHTSTFGDAIVTVLSSVGILALMGFFIWLASPLFSRQPQRRRYQRRRRTQRPPQSSQLPAGQQWVLRQEIQRLEQHLQRLEQQRYQDPEPVYYPDYQEEEALWAL